MSTTHIVKPGENLAQIARHYKIANWREIYHHSDNAEFRQLRPNPNILFEGDEVVIPEQKQKTVYVRTGANHRFVVKESEPQKLVFRLQDAAGQPLKKLPLVLDVGGATKTKISDHRGHVELALKQPVPSAIKLDVFGNADSEEPSHQFMLQLGFLDPVNTVSGVQARLNNLGHDCGVADGIYGSKTKSGIESFERAEGLPVRGSLSAKLYSAVEEAYGC